MITHAADCGVAQDDARNLGPIALFRPQEVTRESARELLSHSLPRAPPTESETRVDKLMARIAHGPVKPPAPLSQSLDQVDDPHYGLGSHPDIIKRMWKLDDALPQRCRWVVWGKPALVHPRTGVIFGLGFGTIGFVLRLPRSLLAMVDPVLAPAVQRGNPGQSFDIGPAGPEWRFILPGVPQVEWCRQAYKFAGEAA